eukprot:17347-Heterococcus_DN1.PRE.9
MDSERSNSSAITHALAASLVRTLISIVYVVAPLCKVQCSVGAGVSSVRGGASAQQQCHCLALVALRCAHEWCALQ